MDNLILKSRWVLKVHKSMHGSGNMQKDLNVICLTREITVTGLCTSHGTGNLGNSKAFRLGVANLFCRCAFGFTERFERVLSFLSWQKYLKFVFPSSRQIYASERCESFRTMSILNHSE